MAVQAPSRVEELQAVVQKSMKEHRIPGAAVGIINGDEEIVEAFGVTSVDHPVPVTPETLFLIGSTTKTVTGLMAMKLVEEGKLSLDEPVRTYIPDLQVGDPEAVGNITLRHLLTHTGGFDGDYFCDFGRGDDALKRAVESMKSLSQIGPTGELWSYCNSGFYIVGRLIEIMTGETYEAAARRMVFEPIGLKSSYYFPEEVMTYLFAVGHSITDDAVKTARPWGLPRVSYPPGGIISTIPDNLKYARFLMGDGTGENGNSVVRQETLELMRAPAVRSSLDEWMGLTWFSRDHDGVRIYHHGGTVIGQVSSFAFVPDETFALAVLTNGNKRELLTDVTKWAYKTYLGVEDPKAEGREPTAAEAEALAGRYESLTTVMELKVENGALLLHLQPKPEALRLMADPPPPPPPMRLGVSRADRVIFLDGPLKDTEGEIVQSRDGQNWLRLGLRLHRRIQ
ncbi:MAG TPA: serine hydrolase domain-containing protein [Chloroflexota bacterium]|jgi:CubicO group peptidase (beta-lactamase class C family)|nr:serine hydrolase domain-containing protein [Chloroflexota bacterium]